MTSAALIFVLIFTVIILVPCVGIGWIGFRLITKLGRYPSKTPAIQISILIALLMIEIVSITLILTFFKILAD